jgi:hypothetical protein
LQETGTHVIKDYCKRIANEKTNARQKKLIVENNKLYVATMLITKC